MANSGFDRYDNQIFCSDSTISVADFHRSRRYEDRAVDRRDFLLLRVGAAGAPVELSCERLLMKYVDAQMTETTLDLFERLDRELETVREVKLVETEWLAREDFRRAVTQVLDAFRARGGKVT